MEFLPADYLLGGLTIVMAVTGLFRGLSGTLAFVLATAASALTGSLGWMKFADFTDAVWMRAGATLIASLLAFGLVRIIVRKLVNGLVAQPADALFGMLIGLLLGALAVMGWAWSGIHLEYSNLVQLAAGWL